MINDLQTRLGSITYYRLGMKNIQQLYARTPSVRIADGSSCNEAKSEHNSSVLPAHTAEKYSNK